jgi:hypothetical protein
MLSHYFFKGQAIFMSITTRLTLCSYLDLLPNHRGHQLLSYRGLPLETV